MEECLKSAGRWGLLDLFGGGLFSGFLKRTRVDDAAYYLEIAKKDLRAFKYELNDLPDFVDLKIEIGGFLSFADYFFDGFVADYLVQEKINDARERVRELIRSVESLLMKLRAQ